MDEKELAALKESNPKAYESYVALKGEHDKLKAAPAPKNEPAPKDDPTDLAAKAAKEREEKEKGAKHEKDLESSIRFTSAAATWAKENAALLPKNVESILAAAEKENYGSTIQKASAVKEAIVLEFFGHQVNLDLLTASQKSTFDEFKGLTKDKRIERAQQVYDSIFEPTFETLKKVKRAEQVSKGFKDETQGEQAYKDKRLKMARKQHLGEKN
jgi:hypothetical protein